jgi:hypothetical protein
MKRLIDAVAKRLGYVSGGTFDDITEIYARRILELGDEIEALKRKVTNLTGMLAAGDALHLDQVADLTRKLRAADHLYDMVARDRNKLTEAVHAFRAATEDF